MDRRKLLFLMLALCLAAGCAAGPERTGAPLLSPPPESIRQPVPASQPESPLPLPEAPAPLKEEPPFPMEESLPPPWEMGCSIYGTLYRIHPVTGEKEMLREKEGWSGCQVEAVSPSGNRILLSINFGSPATGRDTAWLSLYDVAENRLFNLRPPDCELPKRPAMAEYDFFGPGKYLFTDERTLFYSSLFVSQEGIRALFYHIGEEGVLSPQVLTLETPPLDREPVYDTHHSNCLYLKDQGILLFHGKLGDQGEWFAWDARDGRLLGRSPGENAPFSRWGTESLWRKGERLYQFHEDLEAETFDLVAYNITSDTLEVLATGPLMVMDGWINWPHLAEIRRERIFRIQAGWPQDPEGYWEALWDREKGGPIEFTKQPQDPIYTFVGSRDHGEILTTLPDGRLLVLEPS